MTARDVLSRMIVSAMIVKGRMDLNTMIQNTVDARRINEKLLFRILKKGKDSEFGRKHHFDEIKTVEDYRRLVPISTYSGFEEYVMRMINNNETNLLTTSPVISYVETTGTTGNRKYIPITQEDVNIYTKYTVTRMLATAENYQKGRGTKKRPFRGMFVSPAFDRKLSNGMMVSNIPDIAAKQLSFLYPYILNTPFKKLFKREEIDFKYLDARYALEDRDNLYIFCVFFRGVTIIYDYIKDNWETLVEDIEKGTVSDLALANEETRALLEKNVKPNPERAAELRREFEKGFDSTILNRIWPNMEVICGLGTHAFAEFAERARSFTENIPYDYSIYGASEGLFAAVDEVENTRQLMLLDSCYYEFIPQDDDTKVLNIDELEIGKEYELIITNQAGFYRYSFGDIIKVVGYRNTCPYVEFAYRKGALLNLSGEKTSEEIVKNAVEEVSRASGCEITSWAVMVSSDAYPYHYEILIENPEGRDLSTYCVTAEETVRKLNPRYDDMRGFNMIGPIGISNLKKGTQDEHINFRVKAGAPITQVKPIRILSKQEDVEFFQDHIIRA